MSEKFTRNDLDDIERKLDRMAKQTQADPRFAAELEERLRGLHQPDGNWLAAFSRISPTLRWVALMVLLGLVLSWSIRSLIPAPQPAVENTPAPGVLLTPTPAPTAVSEESVTPETRADGYDFRGAQVYLETSLPDSPTVAHVYLLKQDEPATEEQARALADRFGIQGEVYTAPNYVFNTTDYVFSDGKQSLQVYSERYFSYTANIAKTIKLSTNTPHEDAEATIREFLLARGFDFEFSILPSDFYDAYIVRPLSPDSIPMQYESYTWPALRVTLDENGEVLSLDATLMDYDSVPVGEYGIVSAQEAFEKVLNDDAMTGKMEFVNSPDQEMRDWFRSYSDNKPVTAYGYVTNFPAAHAGTPPLVLFDGVPVTGNISGLESLDHYTFVKATGQFTLENGIRKLNVETWDRKVQESSFSGSLSRQGDQIILTLDNGSGEKYALMDSPADLPLDIQPPDWLEVYGAIDDGRISWTFMRLFGNDSGGGGGGSGLGFYKLNLDGPPVAFPSPTLTPSTGQGNVEYVVKEGDTVLSIAEAHGLGRTPEKIIEANEWLRREQALVIGKTLIIPVEPQPVFFGLYTVQEGDTLTAIAQSFDTTVDELMRINNLTDSAIYIGQGLSIPIPEPVEQPVQDLRGTLSIKIKNKSDGTSVKEYELEVPQDSGFGIYTMEGPLLHELDPYNALPILITGTINTQGKLVVDSYKIPYPDLQFQILKGTQKTEQIDGQGVVVFTTEDGDSYVEFIATNNIPNTTFVIGIQGDLIEQEVLIIPGETFGGYPVAHIHQGAIVQEGSSPMEIQGNRISTYSESEDPTMSPDYAPPNLTIDYVELVYYVSNPYYQVNDPNYNQRSPYTEPAWHFRGRYDDGTVFDVLIQALKQEFLLPELAPHPGMG
ncbi:MAG TPA: LysM peptidoglycan-binding domain-containing protein [Anaerolineales bacterium]|nr:LysM peptidoglycan-binding domain-containing protein [Anaerolineales bacterium]